MSLKLILQPIAGRNEDSNLRASSRFRAFLSLQKTPLFDSRHFGEPELKVQKKTIA
jgi:hypothetical protein